VNIILIIRLIGFFCWLFHRKSHSKVADVTYDATETEKERSAELWMCRKCGKTWEVPS
jgi:rubrerythrin